MSEEAEWENAFAMFRSSYRALHATYTLLSSADISAKRFTEKVLVVVRNPCPSDSRGSSERKRLIVCLFFRLQPWRGPHRYTLRTDSGFSALGQE